MSYCLWLLWLQRELVEALLHSDGKDALGLPVDRQQYPIICDNLKKIYPARGGGKKKVKLIYHSLYFIRNHPAELSVQARLYP